MTCGAGEMCINGECRCGNTQSCVGEVTGSYCDSENNRCKCSKDQDACTDGLICINGICQGKKNIKPDY